jgi:hypothetical protein
MTVHDLPAAAGGAQAARIEIGVVGRWNACALLASLSPSRPFMIQRGPERWVVHAQTPGCRGEGTSSAITAIEDCLDARGVEATSIRVDGEPYRSVASLRSLL